MVILALMMLLSQSVETRPLSYLVLQGDTYEFDAAVTDVTKNGATERALNIVCQKGCSGDVKLFERIEDFPLGLFRMSDESDLLLTTWVSGSAYKLRGYNLTKSRIYKVIEVGSVSQPTISSNKGHLSITVSPMHASGRTKIIQKTYLWDGKSFDLLSK
jgi:hypothetical protein